MVNHTFIYARPVPIDDTDPLRSQIDWIEPKLNTVQGKHDREDHALALAKVRGGVMAWGQCFSQGEANSTKSRAARGLYGNFRIGTICILNLNEHDDKERMWMYVAERL